jgi:hypothetical protein
MNVAGFRGFCTTFYFATGKKLSSGVSVKDVPHGLTVVLWYTFLSGKTGGQS